MKKLEISEVGKRKYVIEGTDISLADTFGCGQCFRWRCTDGRWTGVASGKAAAFTQTESGVIAENVSPEDIPFWTDYLDLERDYSQIAESFADDPFIRAAAEYGKGIRILHQQPLETLISFIISSNNNIKRISKTVEAFCTLYGSEIPFGENTVFSFPDYDGLEKVTMTGIQEIHAGFRDRYICDTVNRLCADRTCLNRLSGLDDESLEAELTGFLGVGKKVSACIMLFGFRRFAAFPKDVWINRVISNIYGDDFDEKRFGEYAGIIQQYMFHYGRRFPERLGL